MSRILTGSTYRYQISLCNQTGSGIQKELDLGNLLVHFLHELDNKVDQLMLQHCLGVVVRDQERNVVALHGLAAEDKEVLSTSRQEAGELTNQNLLDFICLLDADRHPDRIDAWLDEDSLILIT